MLRVKFEMPDSSLTLRVIIHLVYPGKVRIFEGKSSGVLPTCKYLERAIIVRVGLFLFMVKMLINCRSNIG